jgi:cyanate permease
MDENETIPLVPPTPPTVEMTPPKRPLSVTVLAVWYGIVSLYLGFGSIHSLLETAWYAEPMMQKGHFNEYLIGAMLLVLACVSAVSLFISSLALPLRQRWARRVLIVSAAVFSACSLGIVFAASMHASHFRGVLYLGIVFCSLNGVLPLLLLTRPAVKAWFDHRR